MVVKGPGNSLCYRLSKCKDLPYFEHAGIIPYISGNPQPTNRASPDGEIKLN